MMPNMKVSYFDESGVLPDLKVPGINLVVLYPLNITLFLTLPCQISSFEVYILITVYFLQYRFDPLNKRRRMEQHWGP